MRHQHYTRLLRLGMLAGLLTFAACAEDQAPAPAAGLLTDYASGVDASFGVETFNLGEPTITVSAPTADQEWMVPAGGSQDVVFQFTTANFTPGKINCYLDGTFVGATTGTSYTFKGVKIGYRTLACVLVDTSNNELTNAQARGVRRVVINTSCGVSDQCEDGLACSAAFCIGGKCKFEFVQHCCGSKFDCTAGEYCIDGNTTNSQCSSCLKDSECADNNLCTTDFCDLTGDKGKCNNVKKDPECCLKDDSECDDGVGCTVDSCDATTNKCKHTTPAGTCCFDSECTSDDPCLIGQCVGYQCRFEKNYFRQDCCSPGTNTNCDDANYCTIDKCDDPQAAGWTKCTHVKDATKPNCCVYTGDCDDNQQCTWDVCSSNQCSNIKLTDCCDTDKDCDDASICTLDTCDPGDPTKGKGCKHTPIPGCCDTIKNCDDGKFCTYDVCNLEQNICQYPKKWEGCCDFNTECDDGQVCTGDVCVNHACYGVKDKFKPNCCDSTSDCNDGLACTIDSCDTATNECKFVDNGDPTCCNGPEDCDDNDCTTTDFCDANNKCAFKAAPGKCKQDSECNDGNACTADTCDTSGDCGVCKFTPKTDCCEADWQCNDGDPCTIDTCAQNKCQAPKTKGCCIDDKDALTACDDNNPCTIDYCLNNTCRHSAPKNGCCTADADCSDGWDCTLDTCKNIVDGSGTCSFDQDPNKPNCNCTTADDCNDNNQCTQDACAGGICTNSPIQGCCIDKFDCDDGNACSEDYCIFNSCVSFASVGAGGLCCSVENEASECGHLTDECKVGKCKVQPDGSRQCVAEAKAVCSYELNYCQDFSSSPTLALMGWNPTDLKGTASSNWAVDTQGSLGPDNYARLTWTPIKTDFNTCLQSPVFQAAGAQNITIQLDREFQKNSGDTTLQILGTLDGASVDWTKATVVGSVTPGKSFGPETITVALPPELSGSNGLRLALCASGGSTYNLTRYGVDNFCVAKGNAPSFIACPPNQSVLAGTTKNIPIKAKDLDVNDIVSFQLVKAPSFISMSGALYYWIDASWNSTLTLAPQPADIGDHEVTIKVTDGHLYKLCTFTVTVTYEGGVLIWKPSEVPMSNAQPLFDSVKKLGKQVQVAEDLSLYKSLTSFDAIFVLLGVFPDNHVLKEVEVGNLKLYLSGGGKMYMEGGDTWSFDAPTSLHNLFKVQGVLDSAPNGVTGPLTGYLAYADHAANKNFKWAYSQDFAWNNLNDQISGVLSAKRTGNLLANTGIEKFWVHVAHDNDAAKYRTVASSILYGGVKPDQDSQDDLLKLIFNFFANGFKDCSTDAECDDGNPCSKDTCGADGTCSYANTCMCNAQTAFKCGDKATKLVTNGGASTDIVNNYSCLPGLTMAGKEIAYSFKSDKNVPVVVNVTHTDSDKVKIFVLKETDKGCDPSGCMAKADIVLDKGTVSFPAQANTTYYFIIDGVGDTDSATFDIEIDCSSGEICDDGIDNNKNGKVDCDDWASCCGHPKCGEVCDGIDNDCDTVIDEGCDEDGDGFCGLNAPVKQSAKCTKSKLPTDNSIGKGDDCADKDGTVNPGAKEICGNNKDDNCNGQQDEEGADGCTNYYADLDGDGYGAGSPKCFCNTSGAYKATKGGDCDDANKNVNPGANELCSTPEDDDCDGDTNDVNADGCKNYYTDQDTDGWGTTPFKCICKPVDAFQADKPGDCDDANQPVNPTAIEICNNLDDNCDGATDEGCDDDKDGYCDYSMKYDTKAAPILICPKGGGDTDDENNTINPEGKEICDDLDNNSDGKTDEGCDDDGDTYCDSGMVTIGQPKSCVNGGGDCIDTNPKVNPGMSEDCSTPEDDNCNGETNDIGAQGCKPFFYDGDGDNWGTNASQCLCIGKLPFAAVQPGDCKDDNKQVHPEALEMCNNLDDDCDKQVDEGCDTDGDKYCEKGLIIVGTPAVCSNGGGDCDDDDAAVNPGMAEICGDGKDNNCNGSQNDENAIYCIKLYKDGDSDTFGAGDPKCYCEATTEYKTTKKGDCDDTSDMVAPGKIEVCDDKDNNCDGVTDEGCDDDKDGYCDGAMQMVGTPKICPKGGKDCDDQNPNAYTGKGAEICDNKDDDCDGKTDNGCDDDQDGYCDANMLIGNTISSLCSNGVGDCDDYNFDVHPGANEICNNKIDDDCDGSQNDENAKGCTDFYFDADNDKYGVTVLKKCMCEPEGLFRAPNGGDCKDDDPNTQPGTPEVCDNKDNDCDGVVDNEDAQGCSTLYLDNDKDGYGLSLGKCLCSGVDAYTAAKKGDCNDANGKINPGVTEICNDADDNCDGAIDEKCNKDGDDYCDKAMTTVGFPNVCKKGGGDCNDDNPLVSQSGAEICDDADNDCDGSTDEVCDKDNDGYCDGNYKMIGTPAVCPKGGNDCNDSSNGINPGMPEVCGNTTDENCNGTYNDVDATGCKNWFVDKDNDTYGDKTIAPKCMCTKEGDFKADKGGDCDDANYLINGGTLELCDGIDNNCDGKTDEGCDDDGDGYCDANLVTIGKPATCPSGGGDCNDEVKAINPGATEVCGNNIDENCDKSLNAGATGSCTDFYYDGDGDGFGVGVTQCLCTPEGKFNATKKGDCDDSNPKVNPDATEVCGDGIDNNCNGTVNEPNATNCTNFFADMDKDGYGAGTAKCQCVAEGNYLASVGGDCDDNNNTVKPGGLEICDAIDNNCDKAADEGCDDDKDGHCDSKLLITEKATCLKSVPKCDGVVYNNVCYQGFPTLKTWGNALTACEALGGSLSSVNSENENKAVRDAATKACGSTNAAWIGLNDIKVEGTVVWSDGSKQLYGNWNQTPANNSTGADGVRMLSNGKWEFASVEGGSCYVCKIGKVTKGYGDDCDDTDPKLSPSEKEICDDKDNNCDKKVDDKCDGDGDGFCDVNATVVGTPKVCNNGVGDCNDGNAQIYPGKTEICDDEDNNCDGKIDLGCDDDKDGYCDSKMSTLGLPKVCPKGGGDCADTNDAINPGKAEVCGDGLDNNCAGGTDELCNDADGDGYCKGAQPVSQACPKGGGDCNDSNKNVNPGASEDCNTPLDDDCNGKINEIDALNCSDFYLDEDQDGFGAQNSMTNIDKLKKCADCGTGKDGDFIATANKTIKAGTYEYKSFIIEKGVTVTVEGTSPLVLKVTGKVTIDGVLNLSGKKGANSIAYNSSTIAGGAGGPGGAAGGNGYYGGQGYPGKGNGGGKGGCNSGYGQGGGGGGFGTNGQNGNTSPWSCSSAGQGGQSYSDQTLTQFTGGSGGGGGGYGSAYNAAGGAGGGGGGALRIDAQAIVISASGSILANGGAGGDNPGNNDGGGGGGGSGGALWLRSDLMQLNGTVSAAGGKGGIANKSGAYGGDGGDGGAGRIRIDAIAYSGNTTPAPYFGDGSAKKVKACLCVQNEQYGAKISGDCDDANATINPNAIEICDGKDNSCAGVPDKGCDDDKDGFCQAGMTVTDNVTCPKTGTVAGISCKNTAPQFTGSVINMNTRSHGGGYHPFRKEIWYPQWAGYTIYRYNPNNYQYIGSFNSGQYQVMGLQGDLTEDAWYSANWGYSDITRREGMKYTGYTWRRYIGTTAGGVAVDKTSVYGFPHSGSTVYVLDRKSGNQIRTFQLKNSQSYIYGGVAIHDGKIYRATGDRWVNTYDLQGNPQDIKFQIAPWPYNAYYDGEQFCYSSNSSSVYCYKGGGLVCTNGDDCVDTDATVNPGAKEVCDDKDNNCNTEVDESCDKDNDNYCDSEIGFAFGNCCSGHGGKGCSVNSIQKCLCAKPGYDYCCTAKWDDKCAAAVKSLGCDTCKFPSTCPAGGNDCNDTSNKVNPGAAENCGTPDDDDCNGTANDVNALGCSKFYIDKDGDKYGGLTSQCLCKPGGEYGATTTGDCDDNNPKVYNGAAPELCDNADNNCNGTTDEGCDDDGDGYCDSAKIVIDNKICPKSPISKADCGNELLNKDPLTPVTLGIDHKSYGGGYHPFYKEFWYPEYNTSSATVVYRYDAAAPYKFKSSFGSGLSNVRQIHGEVSNGDWYASVYTGNCSGGVQKLKSGEKTTIWQSPCVTSYMSGVAAHKGTVYSMRYYNNTVYAFNAQDGKRDTSKEFSLNTYTGSSYGIGIIDGRFYRISDNNNIYRYGFEKGVKGQQDGIRIQTTANNHAVAVTDTRICVARYNGVTVCYTAPSGDEDYTVRTVDDNPRSHGGGWHDKRQEYWFPQWSGSTVYRYNSNRAYLGSFNSGQSQIMGLCSDTVDDAWYSANWGYNTITRREGAKNTGATWSYNIGSTAGGVTTDGTYVYAMRHSGNTVWRLSRAKGALSGTFSLSGWTTGSIYGGLFYKDNRLWRVSSSRYAGRYQMNGKYDNFYFRPAQTPYVVTYDGEHLCTASTSGHQYCHTLPDNDVKYQTTGYNSGSYGTQSRTLKFNTRSHGGGWNPKAGEFWYPQWSGSTVYRYSPTGASKGTFNLPRSQNMQLWAHKDGTFYTANWGYGYATGYNENKTIRWTYQPGGTIGGVACDDDHCYVMRYNSSTVWAVTRKAGSYIRSFNLQSYYGNLYGGLHVVGDHLYYASSNRYLRGYDKYTGRPTGESFYLHATPYSNSMVGNEICVSSNSSTSYCYKVGSAKGTKGTKLYGYSSSYYISSNNWSHGAGYHPKFKEYWFPEWSGEYVYRYNDKRNYVGQFLSGQSQMMGMAAEASDEDWYSANWGYSTITRQDGMNRRKVWTRNIGSTAGGVGVDDKHVYGFRHGSSTVYQLNKATGGVLKTFNLSGASYQTSTLYGGIAIRGGKIYRGSSNGWVERFNLSDGKHDGLRFHMQRDIHGASYNPANGEFCGYHNSYKGEARCVMLTDKPGGGSNSTETLGVDTKSYGGGYHRYYKEYWYPQWTSSNSTKVYRYSDNTKYQGEFNSGLQYVRQIEGDEKSTDYYAVSYSGSSTYSRAYRLKAKSSTKVWTSPYVTSYWGGMALDGDFVYTMRYYSGERKVYAYNKSNGQRRQDKEFELGGDWSWCNTHGISIHDGKLYRTNTCNWVYRYNMSDGQHDNVRFTTKVNPDAVTKNSANQLCVADNNTPSAVYCYPLPDKNTNYTPTTHTVATYGQGAGYHHYRSEYWFPKWDYNTTTIFRYNQNKVTVGSFSVSQRTIQQVWGDTASDHYYTANYQDNNVTKRAGLGSNIIWNTNIGSQPGGVAGNDQAVYAMRRYYRTVYQMNKSTGKIEREFDLTGDYSNSLYGGLAIAEGKLFRGGGNNVYRYNLSDGSHDGLKFPAKTWIYGALFDGENYCYHESWDANTTLYCVPILTTNCTKGSDCDDTRGFINPGAQEICDDTDNNCDDKADDGCDDDGDGYCDNKLVTYGTPTSCPKGGGDCDDTDPKNSPAAIEVCDGKDNNCDLLVDEENAQGCTTHYFDGDNDGFGLESSTKCLCKPEGFFKTKVAGDCDDKCQDCAPGKPEMCDGKDNDCAQPVINNVAATTSTKITFNNSNMRYGACWHKKTNEYWFTYWSSPYIWKYNASRNYVGNFYTGQYEMMGLACDDTNEDYYTANWGYGTVSRRRNSNGVWQRSIGAYPGGVTYDKDTVYAMKYNNNTTTLYRFDRANGTPKTNVILKGWGQFCTSSTCAPYDGLEMHNGKLWRISRDRWVHRYDPNTGAFDKIRFQLNNVGGSYADHTFIDKDGKMCVGSYGRNDMYCYTLPDSQLGETARELKMKTYSYGGGFHPMYSEFWYNDYGGSTIYRYDFNGKPVGSFNGGHAQVRQINAQQEDFYYMARYGTSSSTSYIVKNKGKTGTAVWKASPTTYLSAVAPDKLSVYAQRYDSNRTVWVMDAKTGKTTSTFQLQGSYGGSYPSLFIVQDKIYRVGQDSYLRRYDLKSKNYDNIELYLGTSSDGGFIPVYNAAFDRNNMCVSNGQSQVNCYRLTTNGSFIDENCDIDGDGFCDANKITIGKPKVCPKGGNDCDETSKAVNPQALEMCNNADDNCNSVVDEGADIWCASGKNAKAKCEKGTCKIYECYTGYTDANGLSSDGCECLGTDGWEPNNTCAQATKLDNFLYDNGRTTSLDAKVVSASDVDWYTFRAIDNSDGGDSACDRFNVRVRFLKNPANSLRFQIFRGGCPGSYHKEQHNTGNKVPNAVCCGQTDFNWFTNFKGYTRNANSSYYSEWGECNCTTSNSKFDRSRPGWNVSGPGPYGDFNRSSGVSDRGPNSQAWGYDHTRCHNDTATFFVKVYKGTTAKQCGDYRLEVTNAVYGAPSSKHTGYKSN